MKNKKDYNKELIRKLIKELDKRQEELLKQYNHLIISISHVVGKFFSLEPVKKKNGFARPSFGTIFARIIFAIIPKFGRKYLIEDMHFIGYLIHIIEEQEGENK